MAAMNEIKSLEHATLKVSIELLLTTINKNEIYKLVPCPSFLKVVIIFCFSTQIVFTTHLQYLKLLTYFFFYLNNIVINQNNV